MHLIKSEQTWSSKIFKHRFDSLQVKQNLLSTTAIFIFKSRNNLPNNLTISRSSAQPHIQKYKFGNNG